MLTHQSEKAYVEKIFTFTRGEYLMDVPQYATSPGAMAGAFYAQLKRDGSDDLSVKQRVCMHLGAALTTSEERYQKVVLMTSKKANSKVLKKVAGLPFCNTTSYLRGFLHRIGSTPTVVT